MARDGDEGHEPQACDVALARAFGFLGKRWNGVILGTLMAGAHGFAELRRAVTGISDSVLSERLSELAKAGLVDRSVDEGPPIAVTYQLTQAGKALLPALHELTSWAEVNLPATACASAGIATAPVATAPVGTASVSPAAPVSR